MLTSKIQETSSSQKVNEFQLLLDSPQDKSLIDFANNISPNNGFTRTMDELGVKLTKEKYTAEYHTTFSRAEINAECRKYNLGFVQAREYTGEYSLEFLAKLKAFIAEKKLTISDYDLKSKLYVLAPRSNDLDKVYLKDNLKDPLFFFQVDDSYFVLLEGSKDYISLSQAWNGFKNRGELNCRLAYTIENTVIGAILFFICGYFFGFQGSTYWWLIGVAVLGFFAQFIRYGIRMDDYSSSTTKLWSSYKYC